MYIGVSFQKEKFQIINFILETHLYIHTKLLTKVSRKKDVAGGRRGRNGYYLTGMVDQRLFLRAEMCKKPACWEKPATRILSLRLRVYLPVPIKSHLTAQRAAFLYLTLITRWGTCELSRCLQNAGIKNTKDSGLSIKKRGCQLWVMRAMETAICKKMLLNSLLSRQVSKDCLCQSQSKNTRSHRAGFMVSVKKLNYPGKNP